MQPETLANLFCHTAVLIIYRSTDAGDAIWTAVLIIYRSTHAGDAIYLYIYTYIIMEAAISTRVQY